MFFAVFAMLFALMRTPMRADGPKMRLLRWHGHRRTSVVVVVRNGGKKCFALTAREKNFPFIMARAHWVTACRIKATPEATSVCRNAFWCDKFMLSYQGCHQGKRASAWICISSRHRERENAKESVRITRFQASSSLEGLEIPRKRHEECCFYQCILCKESEAYPFFSPQMSSVFYPKRMTLYTLNRQCLRHCCSRLG